MPLIFYSETIIHHDAYNDASIIENVPDCTVDDGFIFFDDRFCSEKADVVTESSLIIFDR